MLTSFLQSGLFQDAVQGARGQIIARFAWDRDTAWLGAMLELAVAPFVATRCQPSSCSIRSTSLTFIASGYQDLRLRDARVVAA
jgi:hypothetical protein